MSRSRSGELGLLAVLAGLVCLTTLFGLFAVVSLAEVLGPTETRIGRTLEQSSVSWDRRVCGTRDTFANRARRCATFDVPAGAVTGEFPDNETWVVVFSEGGTDPGDVAGRAGTELEVTVSNLTGRVVGLDNGRTFESTWSRATSIDFIVPVAFGVILVIALVVVEVIRRRNGQGFRQLPRSLVIGSLFGAFVLGAFGTWWGMLRSLDQYRAPSSADFYGAAVANPYDFAPTADEADDRADAVEMEDRRVVVRSLSGEELSDDLGSFVARHEGNKVVLLTVPKAGADRILRLRLIAELPSGESLTADTCEDEVSYPTEVGIDDEILVGLFCLPELPSDTAFRVSADREGVSRGWPIEPHLIS